MRANFENESAETRYREVAPSACAGGVGQYVLVIALNNLTYLCRQREITRAGRSIV